MEPRLDASPHMLYAIVDRSVYHIKSQRLRNEEINMDFTVNDTLIDTHHASYAFLMRFTHAWKVLSSEAGL